MISAVDQQIGVQVSTLLSLTKFGDLRLKRSEGVNPQKLTDYYTEKKLEVEITRETK